MKSRRDFFNWALMLVVSATVGHKTVLAAQKNGKCKMGEFGCFERIDVNASPLLPWANGMGARREVAMLSLSGDTKSIGWRVGIAYVDGHSPFSAFVGIDRCIALLEGGGISMKSSDSAINHVLNQPLTPFCFPGEANIESKLLNSKSELFNVLVDRDTYRAKVESLENGEIAPWRGVTMIYCSRSSLEVELKGHVTQRLEQGHAILWRNSSPSIEVKSVSGQGTGLLVHIEKVN